MATEWISPTWRMPNDKNQSKFENYSLDFAGASLEHIMLGNGGHDTDLLPGKPTVAGTVNNPNFSVSAFFNFDSAISGSLRNIIGAGQTGGATYWYLRKNASDNIEFVVRNEVGSPYYITVTGSTVLNSDQWYHAAVSWNGTTITLYLDGTSEANVAATTFYFGGGPGTEWPTIGSYYRGATTQSSLWDGEIGQPCIFDYPLSQDQVNYLYNSGTPQNPMAISGQPPIAYYPLGGSSTGSSSTLTIPNESVPSATVFDFDSSKVEVSNDAALQINGDITISAWVYAESDTGRVVSKRGGGGTNYDFYIESRYLRLYDGGTGPFSSGRITLNEWTHILISVTSGTGTYYINNVAAGTGTFSISSVGTSQPFFIGGAYTPVLANFDGKMSNVQIWDTGLSASEVTTLYNSGVPLLTGTQPQAANLKAWYPMNVDNANWLGSDWQIAEATSAYPQSFDFGDRTQLKRVNVPLAAVNVTNAITVSSWIKTQKNNATRQSIISNYNSTLTANRAWGLQIGAAWSSGYTKANFFFYNDTASTVFSLDQSSSQILTDNNWHNVVAVWDGTTTANAVKIFVDGLLAGQGTSTFAGPIKTALNSQPAIGEYARDVSGVYGGGNLFGGDAGEDGFMSNIQVWDTTLTYGSISSIGDVATGQIAELYNNGSPLTTAIASSNLKGWWKLDNTDKWNSTVSNWSIYNNKYPIPTPTYTSAIRYNKGFYNLPGKYPGIGFTDTSFSGSHVSISAWYRWPEGYNATNFEFLNTGSDPYIVFDGGSSGRRLFVGKYGQKYKAFITDITDGNWHHYLLYFENTATIARSSMRLWQDGVEIIGSDAGNGAEPSALTIARGIGSANVSGGGQRPTFNVSNFALFNTDQTANLSTLYNGGTPGDISSLNPLVWYKADSANVQLQSPGVNDVTFTDSSGNNNTGTGPFDNTPPPVVDIETTNVIAREAATSSGMTEQNLVNNNVSALNGTSSGMTTANLVNSDLTRSIPYSSYSLNFDGGDWATPSISLNTLSASTAFSVSCWVKIDTNTNYDHLVGAPTSYAAWDTGFGLYLTGSAIRFWVEQWNGANQYVETAALNTGQWYHITATFDTTNALKLYVDGATVTTASGTTIDGLTNTIYLGSTGANATYALNGNLNNVAIWNSELTQDQILTIYNGGVPNDISSLSPSAWWSLAGDSYYDGTNFILPDLSASSNNATTANMSGTELVGDGPGSSANGIATSMDIPANLKGDAPNSSNNAFSVNMDTADRVASVPS